jgi:hypothetical protein
VRVKTPYTQEPGVSRRPARPGAPTVSLSPTPRTFTAICTTISVQSTTVSTAPFVVRVWPTSSQGTVCASHRCANPTRSATLRRMRSKMSNEQAVAPQLVAAFDVCRTRGDPQPRLVIWDAANPGSPAIEGCSMCNRSTRGRQRQKIDCHHPILLKNQPNHDKALSPAHIINGSQPDSPQQADVRHG